MSGRFFLGLEFKSTPEPYLRKYEEVPHLFIQMAINNRVII